MENRIISVERILQYTSLPSEPPLVIDSNRPQSCWPTQGEVNIQDLQVRFFDGLHSRLLFQNSLVSDCADIITVVVGSIWSSLTLRATRPNMHFLWREEDWYSRKNRKWKINPYSDTLPNS